MAPWWMRPTADEEDERQASTSVDDRASAREEKPVEAEAPLLEVPASDSSTTDEPSSQREEPGRQKNEQDLSSGKSAEGGGDDREDGSDREPRPSKPRRRRRRRTTRQVEPGEVVATEVEVSPEDDEPSDQPSLEAILRELFLQAPEKGSSEVEEHKIALFCDFENIALGVRDSESKKFEISLVLERLREKGKVIVKKAYSDWSRYSDYKKTFHEAGIELIEIPQKYYSGKNSADIKMVVDAMDLCYSNDHIDTFVVMSGDSDFSPLVSKLKENNKTVIGVGVKNASSSLLIDNCDEFIYYEDLWRDAETTPLLDGLSKEDGEVFSLLSEAILALVREDKEVLWGSMIKQTMKRKRPSFNEGYYGYRTFSELLEDAEEKKIIRLKKDRRSGSYIVTGFASSAR